LGFDFLCMGDHAGGWPSPFTALGAAAAVTGSILLGPYVANAGFRDPLDLATEIATLDIVSDGRAVLGLGAGHTSQEWEMRSLRRPGPNERVDRLIATADATVALLAGERVSTTGAVALSNAVLADRLVRPQIPLLIGGNNRRLLRYAAQNAQIVGLTGLGRTLEGGHLHEARWSTAELEATFELVTSDRVATGELSLQALVQWAEITDEPQVIASKISKDLGVHADHVLSSPFVLIGTVRQIAERVLENSERWGIDSYVVRDGSIAAIGQVMQTLDGL
jgi:probable F420-dependent oxidoreductase